MRKLYVQVSDTKNINLSACNEQFTLSSLPAALSSYRENAANMELVRSIYETVFEHQYRE